MQLPKSAIRVLLALLFLVAVGPRLSLLNESVYPYFRGDSATHYRHMQYAADNGPLLGPVTKANFPEGYRPAEERVVGVEWLTGQVFKVVRYFSDTDMRHFVRHWIIGWAAMLVFFAFGIARRLWGCQGAGLTAAGLVALHQPLVAATWGRDIEHTLFATVLMALHIWVVTIWRERPSPARAVGATVAAIPLLFTWEWAPYYLAGVSLWMVSVTAVVARQRLWLVIGHAVVLMIVAWTLPFHLMNKTGANWTLAALVSSVLVVVVSSRRTLGDRLAAGKLFAPVSAAMWLVGTLVITALVSPFRAAGGGTGTDGYIWARLTHLAGRPFDTAELSDVARHTWSLGHAPPTGHFMVQVLLPLALLIAAGWWATRGHASARTWRAVAVISSAATLWLMLDRSALVPVATLLCVFAAAGAAHFSQSRWRRVLVISAFYLVSTQTFFTLQTGDVVNASARAIGLTPIDNNQFLFASLENTDRELIRFVATRTKVSDPVFAPADAGALLLTFSGRTAVLLEGVSSRVARQREVDAMKMYFQDEATLYAFCKRNGIKNVLYRVDLLLDDGAYGPAYTAGVDTVRTTSAAYRMHFAPETLKRFVLEYENEHYRLFAVTDTPRPTFLTDHPVVYQEMVMERNGDSISSFAQRVNTITLLYSDALLAESRGQVDRALELYRFILEQAPFHTPTRIRAGVVLMSKNQVEQAITVLSPILDYAPDNGEALYQTAYALARADRTARAQSLLTILFQTSRDQDLLERAGLLRAFIERGIPLDEPVLEDPTLDNPATNDPLDLLPQPSDSL